MWVDGQNFVGMTDRQMAELLRFFEGGRRLTMGSHLLIPTTMPSFGKSYVHVIITCDPFWHVPHVSEA